MGVFEFTWPHQAGEVLLAGTFNEWSGNIKLQQTESGIFTALVDLGESEKVYYKYIVDGRWLVNYDAKKEFDSSGNENNVLYPEDLKTPTASLKERAISADGLDTPAMLSPELTPALDDLPGGFPETPLQEQEQEPEAVYEPVHIDAEPPVLPAVVTPAAEREANGTGVLDIPEIAAPETPAVVEVEDIVPEAPAAEPVETMPEVEQIPAASVPEVVKESQAIAEASPEASADETLVEKKAELEEELISQPPHLEHVEVETEPIVTADEPAQDLAPIGLATTETTIRAVEAENQPPVTNVRSVSPVMSPLTTLATPTTHVYTASVPGATFKKGEPAPSTKSSSASSQESHNEKRELFKEKSAEKKKEKRRSAILGRILNLFK